MNKTFFVIGAFLGGLAVALGAFGSHGLKKRLTPESIATFEIGVRYQMYHALAMMLVAFVPNASASGWLFLVGVILFSGSLYALVFMGKRWLGAITPLGGLAFIAGWLFVILNVLNS